MGDSYHVAFSKYSLPKNPGSGGTPSSENNDINNDNSSNSGGPASSNERGEAAGAEAFFEIACREERAALCRVRAQRDR